VQFSHFDLGRQRRGSVITITLSGSAANVRLLDDTNFRSYRSGRQHRYYGGLAKRSPVRFQIPRDGHWHVTVDLSGLRGQVRASVQVSPGALPEITERSLPPLGQIRQNAEDFVDTTGEPAIGRSWDVFISHAAEDKEALVRPLALALQERGVRVWYDEFELRLGDSLRRKIDAGLAQSRFGVVVLSPAFFAKNWPQYELDGLVTREMTGEQVILPVWHRLSKNEVIAWSPSLADKIARNTADFTVEEIADEIADVVQPPAEHHVSEG
jgi:Domain of unknown function (DUF1883)/TIR domain